MVGIYIVMTEVLTSICGGDLYDINLACYPKCSFKLTSFGNLAIQTRLPFLKS